jgi:hypothetical protein
MNQKKKERKERKALQICFHKTITNIQFLETQRTRLLEKETKIWRQGSGGEKRQTQEPHTPVDTTHKGKGTAVAVAVASPCSRQSVTDPSRLAALLFSLLALARKGKPPATDQKPATSLALFISPNTVT